MSKNYPEYRNELQGIMAKLGREMGGTLGAFSQLHKSSLADGALPNKIKELIALAISISGRCDGCIAYHTKDALKAGASRQEVVETIGVAIMMGGGPSMIYGCEAFRALEQFAAE